MCGAFFCTLKQAPKRAWRAWGLAFGEKSAFLLFSKGVLVEYNEGKIKEK